MRKFTLTILTAVAFAAGLSLTTPAQESIGRFTRLLLNSACEVRTGTGAPTGGDNCDVYLRTDGSTGTTLYRKEAGTWQPTGALGTPGASSRVAYATSASAWGDDADLTFDGSILSATGGYKERSRSVAMGEYTEPAYSGGVFTAGGSGTWTVDSGDRNTFQFSIIGKTYVFTWDLGSTSVGGTPNDELYITIPGSFTASNTTVGNFYYDDNGTGGNVGYWIIGAGETFIRLRKMNNASWSVATNTSQFRGTAVFEVQ